MEGAVNKNKNNGFFTGCHVGTGLILGGDWRNEGQDLATGRRWLGAKRLLPGATDFLFPLSAFVLELERPPLQWLWATVAVRKVVGRR